MGKIKTDGFEFDFPGALDVYEFDDEDSTSPHYHGFPEMKAVDIVVEMSDVFLLIELKDFYNPVRGTPAAPPSRLESDLKYKLRDSFLYQWAHGGISKPIVYICVMDHLDSAMMSQLASNLGKKIPDEDHLPIGWSKSFVKSTIVLDHISWNASLSRWGTVVKMP